jgi:hypothetical protein
MTWSPTPTRKHTEVTPLDTRGPKRLWDAPAGVVQRHRGDTGRLVKHDYLCPVHGRFEIEVPASDAPDEVLCPLWSDSSPMAMVERLLTSPADVVESVAAAVCGQPSPWSPSTFGIWASAGEVMS